MSQPRIEPITDRASLKDFRSTKIYQNILTKAYAWYEANKDKKEPMKGFEGGKEYGIKFRPKNVVNTEKQTGLGSDPIASRLMEGAKRSGLIKGNSPSVQVSNEAGKLWDELVGKKGKFTMNINGKPKTFNSRKEYQNYEVKNHNALTRLKIRANRSAFPGSTHGHAVPPQHRYAIETYYQSFAEKGRGPGGNYSDQANLPKDFKQRLKLANVPTTKVDVAQRHVGTAKTITNPTKDSVVKQILKSDKSIKSLPSHTFHLLKRFSNIKNLKMNLPTIPKGGGGSLERIGTDVEIPDKYDLGYDPFESLYETDKIITPGGIFGI